LATTSLRGPGEASPKSFVASSSPVHRAAKQSRAPGEWDLIGRDDSVLDGLQQWKDAIAPVQHREHDLGANRRSAGAPFREKRERVSG
jgi:hypothetical protein